MVPAIVSSTSALNTSRAYCVTSTLPASRSTGSISHQVVC
jgi:hypothetical protein